jgi:hypothetical protein
MDALAVLLITLSVIAAYLAAGWRIAMRSLPRAWSNARDEWGSCEDFIRTSVKGQTICMFLFWPVYLSVRAVSDRLGGVIDAGDPERLKARIAELERELGIR